MSAWTTIDRGGHRYRYRQIVSASFDLGGRAFPAGSYVVQRDDAIYAQALTADEWIGAFGPPTQITTTPVWGVSDVPH